MPWNSSERLKASRNNGGLILPDRESEYPVNYVLDGQQRLSSIYAVFCADREFASAEGEYAADSNVFDIAFRFDDQAFIPRTQIENDRPSIALSSLLDTQLFFEAIKPLSSEHRAEAVRLNSLINNYEILVATISRREKDEVGVIFERMNSTGTRLTTLDLLIAWTWSEDFHLQNSLRDLSDTLDLKGFANLLDKVISPVSRRDFS